MKRSVLLTLLIQLCLCLLMQAKTINDSIPPGINFDKATFRLWYPDQCKTIQGVIVLVPGSNGDGRSLVDDPQWQQLAQKYNFALLGCYLTDKPHEDMNIEEYANVKEGSGQALLDVLAKFALQSDLPELANVPLVLWGHSAGGEFNYEFVCWKPERVLAFVVNKGGYYYSALAPEQARNVPGIIFTGEKDLEPRRDILKGIFSINRRAGALWSFADEPGVGHETGNTQKLAANFFDQIIPLRLHNVSGNKPSKHLLPLVSDNGFAGDKKKQAFSPFSINQLHDYEISWLPTATFAKAWVTFITSR